jgi:hypothetical protein
METRAGARLVRHTHPHRHAYPQPNAHGRTVALADGHLNAVAYGDSVGHAHPGAQPHADGVGHSHPST